MASLHRQPGKPNWFCHFTTADGVRRCRSTGTPKKAQARIIGETWQAAAEEAREKKPDAARLQAILARGVAKIAGRPVEEIPLPEPSAGIAERTRSARS